MASENCLNFRRVAAGLLGRSRCGVEAGADWQEEQEEEDPSQRIQYRGLDPHRIRSQGASLITCARLCRELDNSLNRGHWPVLGSS